MQTVQSALSAVGVTLSKPSIVEIQGKLQPFPYGYEGDKSMAARCAKEVDSSIEIKPDQPYGEIWLGSTHPNGPSTVLSGLNYGKQLKDLIRSDPAFYLGKELLADQDMQELYKDDLPFLFKILSFDKALPLQAHPDPSLGAKLKAREERNKGKNEDFIDENGKPEVSVALTDFSAFVGFRPPKHIVAFLDQVPEFADLFTEGERQEMRQAAESDASAAKAALKTFFGTLIGYSEAKAKAFILGVSEKLESQGAKAVFGNNDDAEALATIWGKNRKVYGDQDVGLIITTYLMNLVQLKKGEGCWILADDIHAYVEAQGIIECMANSDNMVCHGLGETEQGGRQTFVDMLSYRHLPASKLLLEYEDGWSKGTQGQTRLYKVPTSEFDILTTTLDASHTKESFTLPGPHTFVVTEGTVKARVGEEEVTLSKGHTAFVRAEAQLELEYVSGETVELWGSFYQRRAA